MSELVVCAWPLDRPIPYARNSRKIPQRAIDKVAASIKEFGFRQAIVVDKDGVIICGHTRWLAAKKLGLREVPGHVLEQGGWEHLCLAAEYEGPGRTTSIGFSDPRTELGELLWPERFGPVEIESLKRSLGSYAAAGQLLQRPSPAGGGLIKRHWFRYFQPKGYNFPPVIVSMPDGIDSCD